MGSIIGLCAQNIFNILSSSANTSGRYDHLKRKKILTPTSYDFCIHTSLMTLNDHLHDL